MKKVSDWRKVVRIGIRISLKTKKHIPLRGFSPDEIARYLMSEQINELTQEEIQTLREIINKSPPILPSKLR